MSIRDRLDRLERQVEGLIYAFERALEEADPTERERQLTAVGRALDAVRTEREVLAHDAQQRPRLRAHPGGLAGLAGGLLVGALTRLRNSAATQAAAVSVAASMVAVGGIAMLDLPVHERDGALHSSTPSASSSAAPGGIAVRPSASAESSTSAVPSASPSPGSESPHASPSKVDTRTPTPDVTRASGHPSEAAPSDPGHARGGGPGHGATSEPSRMGHRSPRARPPRRRHEPPGRWRGRHRGAGHGHRSNGPMARR